MQGAVSSEGSWVSEEKDSHPGVRRVQMDLTTTRVALEKAVQGERYSERQWNDLLKTGGPSTEARAALADVVG